MHAMPVIIGTFYARVLICFCHSAGTIKGVDTIWHRCFTITSTPFTEQQNIYCDITSSVA